MLMEQHDSIEPPHHTWDGSPPTRYYEDLHCTQFAAAAARQLQTEGYAVLFTDLAQAPPESDDSSGPDNDTDPATRLQTRKEAKALEREFPWRSLLKLPPKDIEAYIQSNQKEERGWMNWGSVQAVSDDEAAAILSNPARRKRVLRSWACYRNKSKIPDQLQAKTRVVALGHLDPDLHRISRDSPTPMRVSEYILLSIYIAGANNLMENDPVPWLLWAGDVSTAFMQGSFEIEERPEPLYLLPPRDEITLKAGAFKAKLYLALKNIYGLASAPRTWFKEVVKRMLSIGYCQHHLDKMLFYKRVNGKLAAARIVYVDDFLLTCRRDYPKEELLTLFTRGSQKELTMEQMLEFKGKELTLKKATNGSLHLHVTQTKFIENTDSGKVQRGRSAAGPPLTTAEQTEFRSVTGSLQWLSSQTRPDIAAWVSLANHGGDTAPSHLASLYETLEYCRSTKHQGLVFQDVAINTASTLVGYADSSWANAQQCSSQQGALVLLTTPHCSEVNTKANLINWRSNRSSRVCRSTLASEATACDDCVDRTYFSNLMLAELLTGDRPKKDLSSWRLNQLQATDCKSLFDAVTAEHPKTTEKRTYVDIRSIQEFIKDKQMRWCPTGVMFADGLTKASKTLRDQLRAWLDAPHAQLTATGATRKESFTSDNLQF